MSQRVALRRGQAPKPQKRRKAAPPPRMVRLPVAPARLRGTLSVVVALLAIVGAGSALWLGGAPQTIWASAADHAAGAGFEVRNLDVRGVEYMGKLPVYAAAMPDGSTSMLDVDLDDVRERLRALPWVADASVARRLPDTLVIDIAERRPAALWQRDGRLAVIDAQGQVLDTRKLDRFASLPLLVGVGANREARALMTTLADFPDVQRRVDSASWIGDRRWDLRFRTGETLALPEGGDAMHAALENFTRMDGEAGLLDKGFVRFDMRLPDKMVVRVSGEPGVQALPMSGTEI